jgi:hypothetical protein
VPGGGPAGSDCLGEWRLVNGTGRPGGDGKTKPRQRCRDGDATCDADAVKGTCTFTMAACLGRTDARLARCSPRGIESWTLVRSPDADLAGRLIAAVEALGPSTATTTTVTFTPALDATERCTADLPLVVPAGRAVKLLTRVTAAGGKPRDADTLKLACRR